jgi:hypothetical protein
MRALIAAAFLLAACSSSDLLPLSTAAQFGYYVDHPERRIPPYAECNAYAEWAFGHLKAEGLRPFYIVVFASLFAELHIVAAVETSHGPVIYDNLYDERPIALSDALNGPYGYVLRGIEIDGKWYRVGVRLNRPGR